MEVSHTVDGYWVLYGSRTYEPDGNIQATMRQAKKDFIKANPLIDSSKVVVVNGCFKQPMLADLRTGECQSLTNDRIAVMANGEPHYKPRD